MKIFTYVAIAIALALIVFNIFQVDFSNPLQGQSSIALIGIVAGFCAILLLILLMLSKKIVDKTHQ
ncbi:hypothetical protein ACFSX9_06025 [Flavobacterium ardleyense]|uniref:Uncharacterized protein n=1 Tax=Flavobacterium ardleyense TaxID=2038737 RepID=A0ABW5Z785_9FLAO